MRGSFRGEEIKITDVLTCPSDFYQQLKNIKFKEDLVEYLLESWAKDDKAPYFENKVVFVSYKQCYRYELVNQHVVKTVDHTQSCPSHEEADTKIVFHACNFEDLNPPYNILLRCSDTDILVIMLSNMEYIDPEIKVWMEVGVQM